MFRDEEEIRINIIYKTKNKKVVLVDISNNISKPPNSKADWHKKSKNRFIIQEYIRKYNNYFLLQITKFLKKIN
jgi:hypothetical protein